MVDFAFMILRIWVDEDYDPKFPFGIAKHLYICATLSHFVN